jgi:uncharacterized protein YukE
MTNLSTNYDNAVIAVDPVALSAHAKNLAAYAKDVADSVKRLTDEIFNLPLGWAGKTSDEVQDFAHRWNGLMTELFGTQKDPTSGALNAMSAGTQAAANAYDGAEDELVKLFNKFLQHSSGGDSAVSVNITDITQTAITETFWS